ncbi:MAG: AAA family ATPase, partial [Bacillota bacterium]
MEENIIIEKLKSEDEINAEEYDGSYKLVQTAVDLYKNIDLTEVDYHDLELIYFLTIGTWSSSYSKKKKLVRKSNLLDKDKEKLVNLIDEIKVKAESGEFNNLSKENETGMFGTGFQSFKKGDSFPKKNKVKIFMEYLIKIKNAEDENNAIEILTDMLPINITNFGVASLSEILHCLKPRFFPVINRLSREVYDSLKLNLEKPNDINNYYKNLMKIKNFRDENFKFKNYRVIDHLTIENYEKMGNKNKNYWKLIPGKNGHKWDEFYSNNFIAIGWDLIDYDQGNIIEQVKENYPNETPNYVKKRYDYFNEKMKIGDLVLLYSNKTILNIALIKSDWYLDQDADEFKNRRKVDWLLSEPVDAEKFDSNFYNKIKQQYTITEIDEKEYVQIIENQILNSKSKKVNFDINNLHFPKQMKDNLTKRIETNLKQGKHIILTGPPGTGKSKLAKEIADTYVNNNYEMVTATSDWSTFDTIGGYRPDKNGNLEFSPGVFL